MKYITFSCLAILCLTLGLAIGCGSSKEESNVPKTNSDATIKQDATSQEKTDAVDTVTKLPEIVPPSVSEVDSESLPAEPETEPETVPTTTPTPETPASEVAVPEIQPEVTEPTLPDAPVSETIPTPETPASEVAVPEIQPEVTKPTLPDAPVSETIPAPEAPASEVAVPEIQPEVTKPTLPESTTPDITVADVPVPETTPTPETDAKEDEIAIQLDDMKLVEDPNSSNLNSSQIIPDATSTTPENNPVAEITSTVESPNITTTEKPTNTDNSNTIAETMSELKIAEGALEETSNNAGHVLPPPPNRVTGDVLTNNQTIETKPLINPTESSLGLEQTFHPMGKNEPTAQTAIAQNSAQNTVQNTQQNTQQNPTATSGIVKAPYDPVKENGSFFVGWDKPLVALVITGQQNGYLEPCSCAGLERMRGGLSRRYTFMKELREKDWPIIGLDVGGMCNSFGKQAELKFHTTISALRAMGYNAVALGKADIGFPAADILSEMVNPDGTPGMFVSSNVSVFERDANMPPTYKIIEAGGLKFGITSALCKSAQKTNQNDEILLSSTGESLKKVLPILQAKSDIRILLSHGTVDEAMIIAKDFPDFQIIVTAGGNPEPPPKPVILPSGQYIVTVGEKGMCAIVLGFFENGVIKYQRVTHDSRFAHSAEVRQMMQSYQDQLKQLWLSGLGIRPVPQTDPTRGANVGPKKCETCHEYQYDIWKKSKHAQAFHSLETATPPRDYDPECVCCHVVGWHRHLYFPYQKGYMEPGKDDYLKNVSCEACHGPGEAHIAAESSSDTANQEAQRAKLHIDLKYAKEKMCGDCHDLDNSPDFDPDKYWNQIQHKDPDDEED